MNKEKLFSENWQIAFMVIGVLLFGIIVFVFSSPVIKAF